MDIIHMLSKPTLDGIISDLAGRRYSTRDKAVDALFTCREAMDFGAKQKEFTIVEHPTRKGYIFAETSPVETIPEIPPKAAEAKRESLEAKRESQAPDGPDRDEPLVRSFSKKK